MFSKSTTIFSHSDKQRFTNLTGVRFKSKESGGFSLLEIIIALGILGAVLLPFLNFISYRLSKERQIDVMVRAVEIAKSKMEEVLLLPDVRDSEEILENKFLLKIKVLDGDKFDEPEHLLPVEVHISIFDISNNAKLVDLYALK